MGGWQAIGSLPELQGLLQPRRPQPPAPAPVSMPSPPVSARPVYQAAPQADQYAPVPKQGMSTGLKIVIGLVCAFVGVFLLIMVISFGYGIWKGFNDAKHADEQRHAASQQQPATTTPPQTNTYVASPTAGTGNSQTWRNPITNLTVAIPDGWIEEDITSSSSGAKFARWFSRKDERSSIGISEDEACLGENGFDSDVNATRSTLGKQNDFLEPEKVSHVGEIDMWEAHLKDKNAFNKREYDQLLRIGNRQCWCISAFYNLADPEGEAHVNTLRAQLLQTMR